MKDMKIFMTLALLLTFVQGAWAENVTFTVCSWDDTNKQVVKTQTTKDCIIIDGQNDDWVALGEKNKETWYAVKDYYYVRRGVLNIFGTVHLVLTDGAHLSCQHIKLEAQNNAKLHIHNDNGDASGNIEVKNWYEHIQHLDLGEYHTYYRYYYGAAAVGGGDDQNMGSLYMHGGTLSAEIQDERPAAIGGGRNGSIDLNHEIVVYAGVLKGETVYTTRIDQLEPRGATIGGSDDHPQGGPITVYGGTLWAICNTRGAGIGGGEDSYGGTFKVYGGNVKVERNTTGDKFGNPTSKKGGAGIGGGYEGSGGDVHIYGGTVEVAGGESHYAIGGYDNDGKGTIELAANMRVTAGGYDYDTRTASPECVFTSAERVPACMHRRWAKIEACDHTPQNDDADDVATTYSIDDAIYHTKHCRYCNVTVQEQHADEDCVCGIANSTYQFTIYEPGTEKNTYVKGTTKTVGAGKKFYLPECTNVPAGYIFKGWEMNPAPEDVNRWAAMKGGDSSSDVNLPAGTSVEALLGQSSTANFYARFLYDIGWETIWDNNSPTTGTMVTISHPDITTWVLTPGTYNTGSLAIDFEDLKDANNREFGTHYVARATYILNGYEYTYDGIKDVISLSDNADNKSALASVHSHTADVTLSDRTLYKDGAWNTLCLPFNLTLAGSPLADADVRTLSSAAFDSETGELTLNFTEVNGITELVAGTPYLIKWASGDNIVNPVFEGVTIREALDDVVCNISDEVSISFKGTYKKLSFDADDRSILLVGDGNSLYYPQAGASLGAQRAYFTLNGITAGDKSNSIKAFVLNFDDEEEVTSIESVDSGQLTVDSWYTINGVKLNGKPTQKGIYLYNGHKYIVQ